MMLCPSMLRTQSAGKLADWIASADNPLFARVMVNRVWHYHFGAGLVKNPNDFGFNGGTPSHPELLDWLATEFIRGGWSLKKHKLILMSQTYQQSSSSIEGGGERRRESASLAILADASARRSAPRCHARGKRATESFHVRTQLPPVQDCQESGFVSLLRTR